MSEPRWLTFARAEIGFHETGDNQGIGRYIALANCGDEGEPWCAIFANAMLQKAGFRGTRSASSQSFRHAPDLFNRLSGPALGAIAVFWRNSPQSGLGHVGFYMGHNAAQDHVFILGGNENDQVEIEALPVNSAHFGLVGYYWPVECPIPALGAVAYRGDTAGPSKVT